MLQQSEVQLFLQFLYRFILFILTVKLAYIMTIFILCSHAHATVKVTSAFWQEHCYAKML